MNRASTYMVFLLGLSWLQTADAQTALQVGLRTDQRVYVVGEDAWIDGWMDRIDTASHWSRILLLDRNGEVRTTAMLSNDKGMFTGFLYIPEELPTDVYFLDAVPTVSASVTRVEPLLVINPRIPPGPGCEPLGKKEGSPPPGVATDDIRIRTEKDRFGMRSPVEFSWSLDNGKAVRELFCQVVRKDAVSDLMDSLARGFSHPIRHEGRDRREDMGHLLKARITRNGTPIAGVRCIAALQDSKSNIAVATSSRDGVLEFLLPRSYDLTRVVISPESAETKDVGIAWIDADGSQGPIPFPCVRLNPSMRADLEQRVLNSRLEMRFHPEGNRSFDLSETDSSDFYGKPDRRYILDDYTRFPVMEEVFTDIISEVRVKKDGATPILQALNSPMKSFFAKQALVMIDGVPYSDSRLILDTDPHRIRVIDVVSRTFTLGDTEFAGIIHLKSYKTDLAGNEPPKGSVITPFPGVQRSAAYTDTEEDGQRRGSRPSVRNLLHRQSFSFKERKSGDKIRFTTSDASAIYRICLYGIDEDGKRIRGERAIFVGEGE